MSEPIIYFLDNHTDNDSQQASNKISNVGGSNVLKYFNKGLEREKGNAK